VGSALAYRSIPLQSAYCAAKHAIVGFTDSLRCELIHDGSHVRLCVVHMPALNTPQFDWVKSRLPHKAQPVAPIFEPEVGARAVVWAAHHNRREVFVGGSTVEAVEANKVAAGLLDRYLGRTGYAAQQTSAPEDPNRPNNLWQPVDANADYGAHGSFDERAHQRSYQVWFDLRRSWVGALGLIGAAIASAALMNGRRNREKREDASRVSRERNARNLLRRGSARESNTAQAGER
jgi:short chain dehydrogenase